MEGCPGEVIVSPGGRGLAAMRKVGVVGRGGEPYRAGMADSSSSSWPEMSVLPPCTAPSGLYFYS